MIHYLNTFKPPPNTGDGASESWSKGGPPTRGVLGPPSFHRFEGRAGLKLLKREGDALEEGTPWWGTVTWVPAVESETAPFKPGFYRVDRVAGRVYVKA